MTWQDRAVLAALGGVLACATFEWGGVLQTDQYQYLLVLGGHRALSKSFGECGASHSAHKHLILGDAICSNQPRRIKRLRRARAQGSWAGDSARVVTLGTPLYGPYSIGRQ